MSMASTRYSCNSVTPGGSGWVPFYHFLVKGLRNFAAYLTKIIYLHMCNCAFIARDLQEDVQTAWSNGSILVVFLLLWNVSCPKLQSTVLVMYEGETNLWRGTSSLRVLGWGRNGRTIGAKSLLVSGEGLDYLLLAVLCGLETNASCALSHQYQGRPGKQARLVSNCWVVYMPQGLPFL